MYVYIVYYSIVVYIYIITTNNKYLWPFCTPKTHTIFPEQELFIQQCPKTFVFFVLRFFTKRTCETSLDGPSMMDSEMSLGFLGWSTCRPKFSEIRFLWGCHFGPGIAPDFLKETGKGTRCLFFLTLEYLIDHDEWWFLWLVKYMDNEKASYLFKATHPRSQRIQTPQRVDHLSWRAPIPALSGSSSIQIWSTTSVGGVLCRR